MNMFKKYLIPFLLTFLLAVEVVLISDANSTVVSHSKTLTNLLPSHTYHYRVRTKNSLGVEAISGDYVFTTNSSAQPGPTLSAIAATNITTTTADLVWSCNVPCTGYYEIGTTISYNISNYPGETTYNYSAHLQHISGLVANTTYHYRVRSKNNLGVETISADNTFTTSAIGPTLTGFSITGLTSTGATLNWNCGELCTGYYELGTSTAYGITNNPGQADWTYSSHSQGVINLLPNTLYHWRVHSKNQANVETISADQQFTTTSTYAATPPTLINAVDPINYGAACNGVTNDSAAFQAAVNASDVLVPAGRTCVINSPVTISINNRHIECGAGAILKQTQTGGNVFLYMEPSAGARLTGNSIANCSFVGTNTIPPKMTDWNNPTQHWNTPILTMDRVDNFTLVGNTFDSFYGQAMFQTTGSLDGGHGDNISYNTFRHCGYYGPSFVSHTNGYIGHNIAVDCAIGVENDLVNPPQNTGGNIIEYNTMTTVYGYSGYSMGASNVLTGGCTGNSTYPIDYSQNIVRNNSISGVSNSQGPYPNLPSRLYICTKWLGSLASQYSNNSCTNGCEVVP